MNIYINFELGEERYCVREIRAVGACTASRREDHRDRRASPETMSGGTAAT